MKVINDLVGYKSLKIAQNTEWFNFSLDSVLLPRFVTINKKVCNILDIGTGNAPIPLILSTRTNANIVGIELQKDVFELAQETVEINKLEKQIKVINDDAKNINNYYDINSFDIVVCNPPYFKEFEKSKKNDDIHKTLARHEIALTLADVLNIASKNLTNNGTFAMVNRTERLPEIFTIMREYRIEPKKIQFIYPKINTESNLVLIEGRKNGKSGIKVLEPIIVHKDNGEYTDQIKNYFV